MTIWWLSYPLLGVFAGFVAGLFGVGGGLTIVPLLFMIFTAQAFPVEHSMHLALGTSMATIVFTSISSMRAHHGHGAVRWDIVKKTRLIGLAELRAHPELAHLRALQRGNRLSITPVDPAEWKFIVGKLLKAPA